MTSLRDSNYVTGELNNKTFGKSLNGNCEDKIGNISMTNDSMNLRLRTFLKCNFLSYNSILKKFLLVHEQFPTSDANYRTRIA